MYSSQIYNTYLLVYHPLDSEFKHVLQSYQQIDQALIRLCYLKRLHPGTPICLEVKGHQL